MRGRWFVLLDILFRMRGRIVDNPALDTQARVRATEENHWHPNIVDLPVQALIDIGQAARLQAALLLGSSGCLTVKTPLTNRPPGAASPRGYVAGS
jgi:hypothetical protein